MNRDAVKGSILDKTEVSRAQVGPRKLKPPTSREYAIQTLYSVKRYAESVHIDMERLESELAEMEKYRHWEILGYASLDQMLEAEVEERGLQPARAAAAALGRHGGARGESGQGSNTTLIGRGAPYTVARLRRDRPALAARVDAGEMTANAAAVEAGFRVKYVSIPLDVERAARAIRKAFGPADALVIARLML